MATWNTKYASSAAVDLVVTATESEVNIANNTSKVTVVVQLKSSANQTAWNGYSQSLSVSIDGVSVGSKSFTYSIPAWGTVTLGTYSRVVPHSSDGTKTARIQVSASGGGDSGSIDKYLGLTTIARASEVSVNPSTVNFGEKTRMTIHKKSSGFTSTVKLSWGSSTTVLWDKITWTVGDVTLPTSLAPPNATTGWGRIIVETYNGTTLVGTKETRLNGVVPNNATWNPTANTPALTEKNTKISSGIAGVWVAQQSKVEYKATFATRLGATAKSASFRVVYNGKTYNHAATISGTTATFTDTPGSPGAHTVQLVITDSRNRTHTSSAASFTAVAYSPPKLSVAKADRKAASPTTILISATASGSHLSNKNTITLKVYVKNRTETSWGTAKHTLTSTNGTITLTNHALAGYAETGSFDVRFELYDELSAAVYSQTTIGTTRVPLDVYKDIGVAIGKMYEPTLGGALQIGGALNGGLFLGGHASTRPLRVRGIEGHAGGGTMSDNEDAELYLNWNGKKDIYAGGNINVNGKWTIGHGVVESGSNENGDFMRFESGLQICWSGYLGTQMTAGTPYGNILVSGPVEWVFPAGFSRFPALLVGVRRISGGGAWGVHTGGLSITSASALRIAGSQNNTVGVLQPIAIGWWK